MPLDQAATLVGIPVEEASEYARKRLEGGELDAVSLHLSAHDALQTGLEVLKKIAKGEGQRLPANAKRSDLEAAQTLVKFALEAKKILRSGGVGPQQPGQRGVRVQLDLWDTKGNWELSDQSK